MARFQMYGLIPEEREHNSATGTTEQDQRNDGDTLIYQTDDANEARAIQIEGGFIPNEGPNAGKWHVITRTVDTSRSDDTQPHPTRTSSFPERP